MSNPELAMRVDVWIKYVVDGATVYECDVGPSGGFRGSPAEAARILATLLVACRRLISGASKDTTDPDGFVKEVIAIAYAGQICDTDLV